MGPVVWQRKLGLGRLSGQSAFSDASKSEFVDANLAIPVRFTGYSSHSSQAALGEWPSSLTYSLEERIQRTIDKRTAEDAIDAQRLDDEQERSLLHQEIRKQYSVRDIDIYRFFHTGQSTNADVNFRLSVFWLNHFTVADVGPNGELIGDYWGDMIIGGLNGSFKDLLYRAISHPAMLTYLDNIYNVGENSERGRECRSRNCTAGLNDNLARELLELHTVTPGFGYSEQDIKVVANILSGWGFIFDKPAPITDPDYRRAFVEYNAEPGSKEVFNTSFSEGPSGLRELTDFLADQEATILFLSRKLLQHFAAQTPRQEDIEAVARVWRETEGDLQSIHRETLIRSLDYVGQRLLWPSQWAMSVLRLSRSTLFKGFSDMDIDFMEAIERDPVRLQRELGDSFWTRRQPNGFSYATADWMSSEHMDRRLRFASLVQRGGRPELSTSEIIELHQFSDFTKGKSEKPVGFGVIW
jgi:uncharacterized protein (DUF1800 family)